MKLADSARAFVFATGFLALTWTGCGEGRLVLDVDVMSYLEEDEKGFTYGRDVLIPAGIEAATDYSSPDTLTFSEGLTGAVTVEQTTVWLALRAANETGHAVADYHIYLSDPSVDPLSTEPVALLHFDLAPGSVDTSTVAVESDPRVGELLTEREAVLMQKIVFNTTESGDYVAGEVRLINFRCRVVMRHSGF